MKNTRTLILTILSIPALFLGACIDDNRDLSIGSCDHEGQTYADQEMFMDDCNSCQCNPEGTVGVSCTAMDCKDAATTCTYKSRVYQDQETFMDDCNTCQCNPEGTVGVACTLVACPPPLDTCPDYQPTVGVACNTDKTCDYFIRESYCMPYSDYDIYARCRCEDDIWRCRQDLEDCWVVDYGPNPRADAGAPNRVMPDALAPADAGL
ncbi:MAG: hypothetical protein JRH20_28870 [Deltaproteobacteria bacterium]|nr:hypothetical protein [Deltaproteobacteria bacterium]